MIELSQRYTVVHIHPEGDGSTALYQNGEIITSGDEYHDDIGAWIDGFFSGIEHAGIKHTKEALYVTDESCQDEQQKYDLVCDPPELLDDYPEGTLTEEYS